MFKKTSSDKDQPNFLTEIKKEFGGHFALLNLRFKTICEKHPKQIFIGMVLIILVSIIFSFTVIVPMEKRRLAAEVFASQKRVSEKNLRGLKSIPGERLDDVIAGIGRMKAAIIIKKSVDAILLKKHLTAADSSSLNTLLDSLKLNESELNQKYKP